MMTSLPRRTLRRSSDSCGLWVLISCSSRSRTSVIAFFWAGSVDAISPLANSFLQSAILSLRMQRPPPFLGDPCSSTAKALLPSAVCESSVFAFSYAVAMLEGKCSSSGANSLLPARCDIACKMVKHLADIGEMEAANGHVLTNRCLNIRTRGT